MRQQFTELYSFYTGGVTEESLAAWLKFRAMAAWKNGWQPLFLSGNPQHPVEMEDHVSNEHCVTLVFRRGNERLAFLTDGFAWGYGGTGPTGLATVLAEILVGYQLVPEHPELHNNLKRFLGRIPMDAAWSQTFNLLAADLLWQVTGDPAEQP